MDVAVRFEGVYKEYPYYQHITAGFKSFIFSLPKNLASLRKTRFTVLNNVSFEVKKGETFGIIGRNGSGKSTILSLIAGVIRQDSGFIETHGKISSLLELGAGFHPELSGVENIILNGILMGNTREDMLSKIDRIIEFSELGEFIYQPLRTYSSGMQVRLGFSVAVHIEPEILLVDEALAVGDLGFQEKCMNKMAEFRDAGATIIIVSHDLTSIYKLCDRAAWIDSSNIMAVGKPHEVIKKYLEHIGQGEMFHALEEKPPVEETDIAVVITAGDLTEADKPASWWDSPVIIKECENIITGDPAVFFYDFLRDEFFSAPAKNGLSICNRAKGIEKYFKRNAICRSFDVVDDNGIAEIIQGNRRFRENTYDLFLCVDLLHRIKDLKFFLNDIRRSLKDEGVIVAFEYIGPANYGWSQRDRDLAAGMLGIMDTMSLLPDALDVEINDPTEAVSSREVIPCLKELFDVAAVKYFGGPFLELFFNRVIRYLDVSDKSHIMLIHAIIKFEQVLIKEGILDNNYAMIVANKI